MNARPQTDLRCAAQPLCDDGEHPPLRAMIAGVSIGARQILRPIDLPVDAGRWTAVVGPNGAGKSTLLRVLAGVQRCDGEVLLQGRPLTRWRPRDRARELAWMGQHEGGGEDLSVYDVVMLGRTPHRGWFDAPTREDIDAVREAMCRTRCDDLAGRLLGELSGGERQRALLARLLCVRARVLLMDEPLSHLDPPHQADWLEVVHALVRERVTVVSVLHELNIALRADVLVVMQAGRVVHHGPPDSSQTRDALGHVFDGRLHFQRVEGQWLALPGTAAI